MIVSPLSRWGAEAQGGEGTCSRSPSYEVAELDVNPGHLAPGSTLPQPHYTVTMARASDTDVPMCLYI